MEGTSPTHMQSLDPLFRAAQITMFRHINGIINLLPVPHQVLSFDVNVSSEQEQYNEKIDDHMSDATWADDTQQLAAALLRYLVVLPEFPWKPEIPEESLRDIGRFSILSLEVRVSVCLKKGCYEVSHSAANTLAAATFRDPQPPAAADCC